MAWVPRVGLPFRKGPHPPDTGMNCMRCLCHENTWHRYKLHEVFVPWELSVIWYLSIKGFSGDTPVCGGKVWNAWGVYVHEKSYADLMHRSMKNYIDGLVIDCSISIADALEILQSCTKPSICWWVDAEIKLKYISNRSIYILLMSQWIHFINSLRPSDAYMRQ